MELIAAKVLGPYCPGCRVHTVGVADDAEVIVMRSLKAMLHRPEKADPARVDAVVRMLESAGPTSMAGCTRILAVAFIHEIEGPEGYSPQRIATLFLGQDKNSGWVPPATRIHEDTPVEMVQLSGASRHQGSDLNRRLAEMLVRLAPDAPLDECSAIGISGDTPALGFAVHAVLAV